MKFVPSRDLRLYTNKVIDDLKEEQEIIVTQNGMPVALMIPIDPKNLNETLNSWQSIKLKKAVRDLRESAIKETTINNDSRE